MFPNTNSAGAKSAFSRKSNSVRHRHCTRASRMLASRSPCPFYLHRCRNVNRIPCNRVSREYKATGGSSLRFLRYFSCNNETRSNAPAEQRRLSYIEAVVKYANYCSNAVHAIYTDLSNVRIYVYTYMYTRARVCVFAARTFQELYFI